MPVSPEEFLEDFLRAFCEDLTKEKRRGKTLFFCGDYLTGTVADLGDRKAITVYSGRSGDRMHVDLLKRAKEVYHGSLVDGGTYQSSGVDGVFYYTFVHVKL